ncbi:MAG: replication protein RepA [Methylomagnum sp.]
MNSDEETQQPKNKKPLVSKRQKSQLTESFNIYTTPATPADLAFIARELVLCTLPHSDPGNVPTWSRTNGNLTLRINPGYKRDEETKRDVCIGYPYGTIPRLILIWMITEILRTKNRRLELGHYLGNFLDKIGLSSSTGRGKRGDAKRVQHQMERLFNSTISFEYRLDSESSRRSGRAWLNMEVAPEGVLWWDNKAIDQGALWGSWIEVGEKFYQAVIANPYPLDIRVLRKIKDSALGIDLYTILNREAYRAKKEGKSRFIAWEWLYVQTGNEYSNEDAIRNFRRKALEQIEQILKAHSGLLISIQKGRRGQKSGLVVSNLSTPSIPPEPPQKLPQDAAGGQIAAASPRLALVPPSPQHLPQLHPATIEQFRERYPLLDPYTCKHDFDAWQEGLEPNRKARDYDKAFLGFASKWAFGKA